MIIFELKGIMKQMIEIIEEFVIPARTARAFIVKKWQKTRVLEIEGKQVADFNAFNLHDLKERLDAIMSGWLNYNFKKIKKLYSNRGNLMFTIVEDRVGVNYLGGHCTKFFYEKFYNAGNHPNCQDLLAESIRPYGLTLDDVHGCFNIFMNVDIDEKGKPEVKSPVSKKGDYVDLLAEMDCLVAISACPSDISACNDYEPKPLKIQIFESS